MSNDQAEPRFPVYKMFEEFVHSELFAVHGTDDQKKGLKRFVTIPQENTQDDIIKQDTQFDMLTVRNIRANFYQVQQLTDQLEMVRQGKSTVTAINDYDKARRIYPKLGQPASEKEAVMLFEKYVKYRSGLVCYAARKHIIFSDFIVYNSIPLLLESLSIEALYNVILKEAKRIGANYLSRLVINMLSMTDEINKVYFLTAPHHNNNHERGIMSFADTIERNVAAWPEFEKISYAYNILDNNARAWKAINEPRSNTEKDMDNVEIAALYLANSFMNRTNMILNGYKPYFYKGRKSQAAINKTHSAKVKLSQQRTQQIRQLDNMGMLDKQMAPILGMTVGSIRVKRFRDKNVSSR